MINLEFERKSRNLLITGHSNSRLPKEDSDKWKIFEALENVTIAIAGLTKDQGAQLRIITGLSSGTDAKAAEIAKEIKTPLHVIAPNLSIDDSSVNESAKRISLIFNKHFNEDQAAFNAATAATDEAKLALSDAIIVVWDGGPPRGCAGGSVRTMIEAIRLFTPIIWIHASVDEAGMVSVIDPSKLDASTLVNLDVDKRNVDNLKKLFLNVTNPPTKEELLTILLKFWETSNIRKKMEVLKSNGIDPQEKPVYAGIWHSNFLSLFGYGQKRYKPKFWKKSVEPYRGPKTFVEACDLPPGTWEWFDQLDRVATHAANRHRDQVVVTHLLSSFAVLGAVAGAINWLELGDVIWGVFELLTLLAIGWVVWHNKPPKHGIWMGFRQAAEALRMSALLHPLLASLPALHRGVWQNSSDNPNKKSKSLNIVKPYQWIVIQLLREAGMPNATNYCLENNLDKLKQALTALIKDQITYHHNAFERNNKASHRLHIVTKVVYFLVIATVSVHLGAQGIHALGHHGIAVFAGLIVATEWVHEQRWLLLITAFFPALAAGLHGITNTLELERLAKNSKKMGERLESLRHAVNNANEVMYIRALAIEVATSMYAEHDAWAGLMEEQSLGIPA